MVKYICQARDLIKVSQNSKKYVTEWKGNEAKHIIKVEIQSLSKRFWYIPNLIKGYYKVCFYGDSLSEKKCSNSEIFCSRDKHSPRHQRQMVGIKNIMW